MFKRIVQLIAAACLLILQSAALATPGDLLFSDDFERAALAPNWTANNATRAGINTDTASSPTRSMYTRHQVVTVTSSVIDLTVPGASVSYWIRRGHDDFSENPEDGEDLIVEYLDSIGTWTNLLTFLGGGTAGQIYSSTVVLPFSAMHANFQLRFRQTGGSGVDFDYWHIDDIVITETASSRPPLTLGSCDDFEHGMMNWNIVSGGGYAGINTATSQSPSSSMFTNGGIVTITSNNINTNNAQFSGVSMWIRRGDNSFSDRPENNERLIVEYLNNALNWITLDTFNGGNPAGEVFIKNYNLPVTAQHSGFQIRFIQTRGSGVTRDFWHVDDVCINGTVPFPTLVVLKNIAIEDDPVNATNPKAIPLSNSVYSIRVSNTGFGSPDNNSIVINDDIPAGVEMFTGNYSGGAPYAFDAGTGANASGVTCNFAGLGNGGDCITFYDAFSNPIIPNGSYDPSVKSIEFRPAGTMNATAGTNTPYFDIDFRVRVVAP